jgi:hypothetical protein
MRRLIYLSLAVANLSEDQVAAIVSVSSLRNNEAGITGMLWFNGMHFAQVIEGEREAVAMTMRRIVQDDRHREIELVSDGDDDRRLFGSWGMTRANDGPERLAMSMIMLGRAREMAAPVGGRLGEIVASSLD